MKKEILKVVFRKFKDGEIIAIFPEYGYKRNYKIESYVLNGQHIEVYSDIVDITTLATELEYKELLEEISCIYNDCSIKVLKKMKIKYK